MSLNLPPTPRDFNIHRLCLVQLLSTRRVAEIHHLSQTRVRQIVARVSQWLNATLPVKTDLEIQQEAQLARNIAADQMRHQLEALQNVFDATGDPKYLRHLTRVIAALARLGVVPGALEALAADATAGPYDPTEPQPPWSEDGDFNNPLPLGEDADQRSAREDAPIPHSEFRTPHSPVQYAICNPQSAPPPPGDCSPEIDSAAAGAGATPAPSAATADPATTSDAARHLDQTDLQGLNLIEKRLLTLIDNTAPAETDRLANLHNTLNEIRDSKAALELRLSPHIPGAEYRRDPSSAVPSNEQEVTETTEIRS